MPLHGKKAVVAIEDRKLCIKIEPKHISMKSIIYLFCITMGVTYQMLLDIGMVIPAF